MFNLPHRKEKPILSMQSMGGGAAGGLVAGGAPPNIDASGGTKTTPGDGYVYHYMTGGQFQVAAAGDGPDGIISICLVGGGGGGGNDRGGGGGGGGFRITTFDVAGAGVGNYACSVGSGGPSGGTSGPLGNRPRAQNGNPSYFQMTPTTKIEVGGGGGGGGANDHPSGNTPTMPKNYGHPGTPSPFPTDSTPHPNTIVYPGSGGGAIQGTNNGGGTGAGNDFNSSPGQRGFGNEDVGIGRGGGGGGAGSAPQYSPTSTGGDGGVGKQLPWALPTWGWGEDDDSNTPGGHGWFAGGGGGGSDPQEFCPNSRMGRSGGGRGGCPTIPYGNGAPGTGGGAGSKGAPGGTAGTGGPGVIMIRYPAP
tara:strand:+ start:256 stop:1341 length:1086 start_codon:yes stop_codon:yes gene_type:complete